MIIKAIYGTKQFVPPTYRVLERVDGCYLECVEIGSIVGPMEKHEAEEWRDAFNMRASVLA